MSERLLVIDGNSILNRAFYGTSAHSLTAADGTPTNAVLGFLNILLKELDEVKPQHLCVAWDLKAPTFRHLKFDGYKAQRKGMPTELAVQLPIIKEVLDAMRVTRLEVEGFEADDIIGAVTRLAERDGHEAVILTGDKDSFQLVTGMTSVRLPKTSQGKTELEIYDEAAVRARYGVEPRQMIDVKGLMGDASDNIPGVAGVGEKTALDLIQKYQTLEGVYEHIDEVTKPALNAKLQGGKDMAFLSRELATILREVPGIVDLEGYNVEPYDRPRLYEIFMKLGFKSLINRLKLSAGGDTFSNPSLSPWDAPDLGASAGTPKAAKPKPVAVSEIRDIAQLKDVCAQIISAGNVSIYASIFRDVTGSRLDALGLASEGAQGLVAWQIDCNELMFPEHSVFETINEIMIDPAIKKFGFDIKQFAVWLQDFGTELQGLAGDVLVAAYVINPSLGNRGIEEIAEAFSGQIAANIGRTEAEKAAVIADTIANLHEKILGNKQEMLYFDVELPLVGVLASMEHEGFTVDREGLVEYGRVLAERIAQLEIAIYEHAGHEFNINSPKQMGVVLFDELMLPVIKKTKTGYSTDADVLEQLESEHEIVALILEYRQLAKLKSTYADGLLAAINPTDGRIHSIFNQTSTSTGRLSSTEPNLQNIPVRHELGREIRKIFVAGAQGRVLVDADYSQIELRVLAHIAQDSTMIHAFNNDEDIHTTTATQIFNVHASEVTPLMRNRAKTVNFSIVYGISDFALSKDLSITRSEAKAYIEGYLEHYIGVRNYMKASVADAKQRGFIETLFHRRRYIPELAASNFNVRSFGERVAMNAPIQGSAADIMKIAMVKVYDELKIKGMKAKLILQVHDEILVEAPREEAELVAEIIDRCMESAADLSIPLRAEAKWGYSWYETK
ncbi:MAG: DNA polymerase I [Bacillota bacterium]